MTPIRAVASSNNLLSTVAWGGPGGLAYALEGSVFIGGAVVQWLRDGLQIIRSASEIEALAASVPDNGGVYLVPAFAGLGAPHWDAYARGSMFGLTRGAHRILNIHRNVPGVLRDINKIVSDLNANIRAQLLATDPEIGYLIIDLDQDVSKDVKKAVADLPTSIKTRILF